MKFLVSSGLDTEWEDYPELYAAEEAAIDAGAKITTSIEGFLHSAKTGEYEVGITIWQDDARYAPGWEKNFRVCIVIFPLRVEMRYYETLDENKYAIHTENFPSLLGDKIDVERFLTGFFRTLAYDQVDLRKAVRMGIKMMTPPASVV